jgi:hypothetical protein
LSEPPADGAASTAAESAAKPSTGSADDYSSLIPRSPPVLPSYQLFTNKTRALIYGLQPGAVQNMLDFDFICGRTFPSVAGLVYPFSGNHYMKFYCQTQAHVTCSPGSASRAAAHLCPALLCSLLLLALCRVRTTVEPPVDCESALAAAV